MKIGRKGQALAAAAIAVVLLMLAWMAGRTGPPPEGAGKGLGTQAATAPKADPSSPQPQGSLTSPPPGAPGAAKALNASGPVVLPALNTRLSTILSDLEASARNGDVKAACRLGMEKARCLSLMSSPRPEQDVLDSNPEIKAMLLNNLAVCEGLDTAQVNDAWKYLAQAALGGSVAAMGQFVRDPALSSLPPFDAAEGWILYKENAQRFTAKAIENGDAMALFHAWFTSATGMSIAGTEVFGKDPRNAVVYGTAAAEVMDRRRREMIERSMVEASRSMGARDFELAREEGVRLRQKYFTRSQPPLDTHDDTYVAPGNCEK